VQRVALADPLVFFSSRRRHTAWPRDWSSDVCSSDLNASVPSAGPSAEGTLAFVEGAPTEKLPGGKRFLEAYAKAAFREPSEAYRSEERRVGKEGSTQEAANQRETNS